MKVAPIQRAFSNYSAVQSKIVHTGQHYDQRMSEVFFNQIELPKPDYFLGLGGRTLVEQVSKIMSGFEEVIQKEKPDVVLVVGDVSSTLACALTAIHNSIPVAHVEAGLRSGDRTMPEEINRIVTDSISEQLFTTERRAVENLEKELVAQEKIHFVGNVMIDSIIRYQEKASKLSLLKEIGIEQNGYILLTAHRASNVDREAGLRKVVDVIKNSAAHLKVLFPVHPRTLNNLKRFGLLSALESTANIQLMAPQGYLEFLHLMENARLVITDSGGVQEETTFLQIPCITFRSNTERPVTVESGTNYLIDDLDPKSVDKFVGEIIEGNCKKGQIPPLWDGHAADRIAKVLVEKYG